MQNIYRELRKCGVSMKYIMRLELIAFLLCIIILLPSNSFYINVPAYDTNPPSGSEIENDVAHSSVLSQANADDFLDITKHQKPKDSTPSRSTRDLNNNKISDLLDAFVEEGYHVLDLVVVYERQISNEDIQMLKELGVQIVNILWYLDMVELSSVPVIKLEKVANLPGVLRLENYGRPLIYSDIATPAVKARESNEYSPFTAWELGYTGKGANIAIVDTGADNGHPTLAGKWVAGVDISKPETFLTPRDGSFDADDTNGHGTTCSGIAMGTGAPEGKYMGAAPDAKLVDVRIGTMIGYAPGELLQSYYDASLQGINWVIEHHEDSWQGAGAENQGIDIISLSWGIDVGGNSDGTDVYSMALDRAVNEGIIVVNAAGNSGPNNVGFNGFAASSNSIVVAASDDLDTIDRADDIIAEYSSRGPRKDNGDSDPYNELRPDVTAPGTHIMQAQYDITGDGSGNGYGNRGSGTSYATPVVAGVVALMLEANPKLTPELAREILRFTSERRGKPSIPELDPFWNKDFGWGVVDAYKAVKLASETINIGAFDVNLQCFISGIEIQNQNEDNVTSGIININGLAFSRDGEVDNIEISIDNGTWKTIKRIEEDGIYKYWNCELDTSDLSNGNHTIRARANGEGGQSLEFSFEIITFNKLRKQDAITTQQLTISIVVILIIAGAVFIYLRNKKKKKN